MQNRRLCSAEANWAARTKNNKRGIVRKGATLLEVAYLDYFRYLCFMSKKRELYFFKDYFEKFYDDQTEKVQRKILWTLRIIEQVDRIPEVYLKHLKNTSGLYEIRVQVGNNIYRIFCFFDLDHLVVIGHGFQKKTQKTPKQEIKKAEQVKQEYYESKE